MKSLLFSFGLLGGILCAAWMDARGSEVDAPDQLPFYTEATLTPQWFESGSASEVPLHRVGSFSLTNQNGKTVSDEDFAEKIRVVAFFFTSCPGICSTMSANMVKVQETFREDERVKLLSFSVMPEVDTVSVLKNYAETYSIRTSKWDLLTGERKAIYDLARNSYFAEAETIGANEQGGIIHSEKLLLIDPDGHIRGVYNGTLAFDMRRLIEDVRTLSRASF